MKDTAKTKAQLIQELKGLHQRVVELERDNKEGHNRLKVLHQIDLGILSAQSPQEIARIGLEYLRQFISCQRMSIAAFNEKTGQFTIIAAQSALDAEFAIKQIASLALQEDLLKQLQAGTVITSNDIENISNKELSNNNIITTAQLNSTLAVPLMAHNKLVGILQMGSTQPAAFMSHYIELAQEVGNSMAVAINQTQLLEKERLAREKAEALQKVAISVNSSLNQQQVLRLVLNELSRVVAHDSTSLILISGNRAVLFNDRNYSFENGQELLVAQLLSLPHVQKVIEQQQPEIISNTKTYPHWQALPGTENIRCWMGIPLVTQKQTVGLLNLNATQPNFYNSDDAKLAMSFANQAVVAIENARLFEKIQNARQWLETLSGKLVNVQEEERRKISRELHDEIGQSLTAIKLIMQSVKRSPDGSNIEQGIQMVEHTLQQVRSLSLDLRPLLLDDLGLVAALRWYIDRQAQLSGLSMKISIDPPELHLSPSLETSCYRITQEAITNTIKHAQARNVSIKLQQVKDNLLLTIQDDGRGFDVEAVLKSTGRENSVGLLSIQERVHLLNGSLTIASTLNKGTKIQAIFPLTWFNS